MKRFFLILPFILLCACQALESPVAPVDEDTPAWLPQQSGGFEWTKAEDLETRKKFLRNFGVGYSYNAVRGSFCDWSDIRCQIVNRQALEAFQERSGDILFGGSTSRSVVSHSRFSYSKRDYVAAVQLDLSVKVDLGLYNKEKRKRQQFLEDGVEEEFYYSLDEQIIMADMFIAPGNVMSYYSRREDCDNFLTVSFVNAVQHVAESDPADISVVDSMINIYGTHVITAAWLGGKIRVDLSNYLWRYKDVGTEEEWDASKFLGLVSNNDSHVTGKDEYKWLENGKLNISAYGGNQSSLTGLLGEHSPDGSRSFSTDGIAEWRNSLFFDPENEYRSNIELVDMRLTPIWEFANAIDPVAGERIKAAILQDVSYQQSLLGENNFFDTMFPIRYPESSVMFHRGGDNWLKFIRPDKPDFPTVVNIVSGGRYVACVCHETVGGRDLWVCYPIYEGKIKMPCGLGVDSEGRAFSVQWLNGKATVLRVESDRAGDYFFINGGEVSVSPQEGVSYAQSNAIPYIELAGGVLPDGGCNAVPFLVERDGAEFVIRDTPLPANVVGWTEDGHRSQDYVYIWNPNELRYE